MFQRHANYWYTAVNETGDKVTFRLRPGTARTPVDGESYIRELFSAALELEQSDQLLQAAERLYTTIPVELSFDGGPIDGEDAHSTEWDEDDMMLDFWRPMQLALIFEQHDSILQLLAFHDKNGLAILESLLRSNKLPTPQIPFSARPTQSSLHECGTFTDANCEVERSAPELLSNIDEDTVCEAQSTPQLPILECEVSPVLGGAVLLLGHYVSPHLSRYPSTRVRGEASTRSGSRSIYEDVGEATPYPLPDTTLAVKKEPLAGNATMQPDRHALTEEDKASVERINIGLTEAEESFLEEKEDELCPAHVLRALHPLLQRALHHLKHAGGGQCLQPNCAAMDEGVMTNPADAVAVDCIWHYTTTTTMGAPSPRPASSLLVDAADLYERCEGDLVLLEGLLSLFVSTLTPVLRGKRVIAAGAEPLWIACAPQEAQRLSFYATWLAHRARIKERGKERERGEKGGGPMCGAVAAGKALAQRHQRAREAALAGPVTAGVWHGHLCLLAWLLTPGGTAESFLDFLGAGELLEAVAAGTMPGALVVTMAAGAAAAAHITQPAVLRALSERLEILLTDDPRHPSGLRPFLSSVPATQAERFAELWLSKTPLSSHKKFKTRVEMMYYVCLEVVLQAAERAWSGAAENPEDRKILDAQAALLGYVALWCGFFRNLTRDLAAVYRRVNITSLSPSCLSRACSEYTSTPIRTPRSSDHSSPPTRAQGGAQTVASSSSITVHLAAKGKHTDPIACGNDSFGASADPVMSEEELEFETTMRNLCESLHKRLQQGNPPLPALCELIYPNTAEGASSSCANDTPGRAGEPLPANSLSDEFNSAQKMFVASAAKLDNDTKLKFYALYKQATVGNINIPKPWLMDLVGRAKWDAWNKLKGMNLTDARRMYVSEYKLMKQVQGKG